MEFLSDLCLSVLSKLSLNCSSYRLFYNGKRHLFVYIFVIRVTTSAPKQAKFVIELLLMTSLKHYDLFSFVLRLLAVRVCCETYFPKSCDIIPESVTSRKGPFSALVWCHPYNKSKYIRFQGR